MPDDAMARLARQIHFTRQAERLLVDADEVVALRRRGASEMHQICAQFVCEVNGKMAEPALELAPPAYTAESFRETGVNLIQIGFHGREMQIAFQAPPQLVSTEKFLAPYILEGEIRSYNQRMLERFEIRSLLLFYCVTEHVSGWRFFDWRTRHTGPVDRDMLAAVMEPLL